MLFPLNWATVSSTTGSVTTCPASLALSSVSQSGLVLDLIILSQLLEIFLFSDLLPEQQ